MPSDPARPKSAQGEVVGRYGRTNPPPSEKVALLTIDELSAAVANITTNLEHADSSTFPDEREYLAWRRRATSALAYTRQELTFLEKWVAERRQVTHQSKRYVHDSRGVHDSLQSIVRNIQTRVRELAEEVGRTYTPRYSSAKQPENLSVANEQMSHLTGVKQRLQSAFSEVTAAWTEHPLRRGDMPGVKAPLQKILCEVEVEIGVVKGYIRTHAAQNPIASDWKSVCAKALTRAVAEGFVLTPAERAVLAHLQSFIESD